MIDSRSDYLWQAVAIVFCRVDDDVLCFILERFTTDLKTIVVFKNKISRFQNKTT
jgi:hypothetical protein